MTLTPEQFNKLATKDDFNKLDVMVGHLEKKSDQVLDVLDTVVKKLDNIEHAFVTNLAAHDRFEKRIERLEKALKLEPMFS